MRRGTGKPRRRQARDLDVRAGGGDVRDEIAGYSAIRAATATRHGGRARAEPPVQQGGMGGPTASGRSAAPSANLVGMCRVRARGVPISARRAMPRRRGGAFERRSRGPLAAPRDGRGARAAARAPAASVDRAPARSGGRAPAAPARARRFRRASIHASRASRARKTASTP